MSNKAKTTKTFPRSNFTRLLLAALAFFALTIFIPRNAYADSSFCYRLVEADREIDGNHFTVLVFGGCDLYLAARVFPQRDLETKKPLPPQVQLRSIYAANGKVKVGDRMIPTVLRGCVPNSKPWPDQTVDEKDFCPGKVNYFPNGFGGEVLIPHTRQPSSAELVFNAAEAACGQLAGKTQTEEDRKALEKCKAVIPNFQPAVVAISKPKPPSEELNFKLEQLTKENHALKTKLATTVPPANRAGWLKYLFLALVGLCVYGAGSTILVLRVYRSLKLLRFQYKQYKAGADSERYSLLETAKHDVRQEIWEQENEILDQARETLATKFENEYRDKLQIRDKRIADLEAKVKELQGLQTVLAPKVPLIEELNRNLAAAEADKQVLQEANRQLQDENRQLNAERGGIMVQVSEQAALMANLRGDNSALQKEKSDFVFTVVPQLEAKLAESEAEISDLRVQVTALENHVRELQASRTRLLSAAGMCGMNTGTGACTTLRKTRPFGLPTADDESPENIESAEAGVQSTVKIEPEVDREPADATDAGQYAYIDQSRQGFDQSTERAEGTAVPATDSIMDVYPADWAEKTPIVDISEMQRRADSTRPPAMVSDDDLSHIPLENDPDDTDQETAAQGFVEDEQDSRILQLFKTTLEVRRQTLSRLRSTIMEVEKVYIQLQDAVKESGQTPRAKTFKQRAIEVDRLLARLRGEQLIEAQTALDKLEALQLLPSDAFRTAFLDCLADEIQTAHGNRSRLLDLRSIMDALDAIIERSGSESDSELERQKARAWEDLVATLNSFLDATPAEKSDAKPLDVGEMNQAITAKVFEMAGEFSQRSSELANSKSERSKLAGKLEASEHQRQTLLGQLAQSDQQVRQLVEELQTMRVMNQALQRVLEEDKPLNQLAIYEKRALEAERDQILLEKEHVQTVSDNSALRKLVEMQTVTIELMKTAAKKNDESVFLEILEGKDHQAALNILLLAIHAVSGKATNGAGGEMPLGSDADMYAMHEFLMTPVVAVSYFKLPNLQKNGEDGLRIHHIASPECAPPVKSDHSQVRRMTVRPPGLADNGSSVPPQNLDRVERKV